MLRQKFRDTHALSIESGEQEAGYKEYGPCVIEAIIAGTPFRFSGNISGRDGCISNPSTDAAAEVPVCADGDGFHPTRIGAPPMHLAAMNRFNLTMQGAGGTVFLLVAYPAQCIEYCAAFYQKSPKNGRLCVDK